MVPITKAMMVARITKVTVIDFMDSACPVTVDSGINVQRITPNELIESYKIW